MNTGTVLLALATAALGVTLGSASSDEGQPTKDFAAFSWQELRERAQESGRAYLQFLDEPTLSAGRYALPKGATDHQQPHRRDEIYYVVSGKAKFSAGSAENSQTQAVGAGTVLYVRAHVPHRFHDIEEDLDVLVLFSQTIVPEKP
jgi:mannose-6-phosphate isomerase-like protein (cupin superfamily)